MMSSWARKLCVPKAGGLVVGITEDANTGAPLLNATVNIADGGSTRTVATPDDPAIADGFYTLFSPAGSKVITATQWAYTPVTATVTVALSDTVRQDFALDAGLLTYVPPLVNVTLPAGTTTSVPMTLTNSGVGSVNYELIELDKGAVPFGPFAEPDLVVKPFKQEMPTAQGNPFPPPPAEPWATGDLITSWMPGVFPWGIAFDGNAKTVWVSSPSLDWYGEDKLVEYSPSGIATGREYPHNTTIMPHTSGPADMAYNFNTGMLWVMNLNTGVANCVYEVDPASGYTGNKICPQGSTGFTTSQRGLAYDASTDTYFAGGWNDFTVYRFAADGTIINSKNTGLSISGLAYNPETGHLFALVNGAPDDIYVLDANNNYAVLGQFHPFGQTGGAGLEIACDGNLWMVDQATGKVSLVESGETASLCGGQDVSWLAEAPITGTLPTAGQQGITLALDATTVDPGVYDAQIKFANNTPYAVPNLPVKMTVTALPSWGKVTGSVETMGYCDTEPAFLKDIPVLIETSSGMTFTATTDASGVYRKWLDAAVNTPVTITVNVPEHGTGYAAGLTLAAGITTTQDFTLRWLASCTRPDPPSLETTLSPGDTKTLQMTLFNDGAAAGSFIITEVAPWLNASPITGTIQANGSYVVDITFSPAVTDPGGTYTTTLQITTGDPKNNPIEVPITMHVKKWWWYFFPLILETL